VQDGGERRLELRGRSVGEGEDLAGSILWPASARESIDGHQTLGDQGVGLAPRADPAYASQRLTRCGSASS